MLYSPKFVGHFSRLPQGCSTPIASPGPGHLRPDFVSASSPIILCIDDEALGLQIRRTVLERAGFRVLTATDGLTGLSLFRTEIVDGVVLDYYMPEMDGGAVAQAMRRERPHVPIMLLSAYINLPAEVVALADVTLLKGEGPLQLLSKLRLMLATAGASASGDPA